MQGLQGREVAGPGRAGARRRSQADHRPAHRLPDDLDDGRRGAARHGDRSSRRSSPTCRSPARPAPPTTRRTPGSSATRPTSWSASSSATTRRAPMGKGMTGGHVAAPDLRQLHEDGAGRQEGRAVPHPARHQARARQPAHGAAGAGRRGRHRDWRPSSPTRSPTTPTRSSASPTRAAASSMPAISTDAAAQPEQRPQRLLVAARLPRLQAAGACAYISASLCPRHPSNRRACRQSRRPPMRAEAEKLADAIRQSLALLRRHL